MKFDFLIIGSGIIGLTIAKELIEKNSSYKIAIIEKENDVCLHASGRNSGVLHAGFYYSANSLKAKFSVEGNKLLIEYCEQNGLKINKCGKLVVATNEGELQTLHELKRRGDINEAFVELISEEKAKEIEPNVKTYKEALYSPNTSTINPKEVCNTLKNELISKNVKFYFNTKYISYNQKVYTTNGEFEANFIINCAGVYADKIANDFSLTKDYVILPFKGLYLEYKDKNSIKTNIYPVPNLKNPFLGVHFTKLYDGSVKIGPTAIPAFWREHYSGLENFSFSEFKDIISNELKLFVKNSFGFRELAYEEIKKYNKDFFLKLSTKLANIDKQKFGGFKKPGIRAQLLDKKTNELVQDFVVEKSKDSLHILNAVSPAFTASISFAKYLVEKYL